MKTFLLKIIITFLIIILNNAIVYADNGYGELGPDLFQASVDLGKLMDYKQTGKDADAGANTTSNSSTSETTPLGAGGNITAPKYVAGGTSNDPGFYIARAIANILMLGGVLGVIMIIISGIQYIMAYGKDENIESAKKTLYWTILGLLAIILAYFIVENVISYLYTKL